MSIVKAAASRLLEARTTPPGSLWPRSEWDIAPPSPGQISAPVAGVSVSEQTLRGVATAYACVGVLCDQFATLPLRQFQGKGPDRKEIDLSPVIYDPWPECTDMDWRTMGQWGVVVRGNFIGRVTDRDRKWYPTQVQPLDNDSVTVRRDSKTGTVDYRLRSGELIPADDVFHVRNVMRPGALCGLNPIEELRVPLGVAAAQERYAAAFFANSALPAGVLETEEDLSEVETLRLARAWLSAHQGINHAHLPAVLTGGVTWKETAFNMEDLQFLESRQFSQTEITMIFRVPPHMIGLIDKTTSWGTGVEQQELGFARGTLGAYIRRWELGLSRMLPKGQYVEADLRKRLRGDSVQRAAVIVSLVNAGVINRNEARILYEDLPPQDGLDTFLQPLNMGDAGVFAPPILPKGSNAAAHLLELRDRLHDARQAGQDDPYKTLLAVLDNVRTYVELVTLEAA